MTNSRHQEKVVDQEHALSENGMLVTSDRHCDWYKFLWLYFDYYIICRRQKKFPGKNLNPALAAWNSIGAGFAIQWVAFIFMVDHYIPFSHRLGHIWIALHLPGDTQKACEYALAVVGFVTGIIILNVMFRGRYDEIMHKFRIYDHSHYDLVPSLALSIIWIIMSCISVYGFISQWSGVEDGLLISVVANICMFITIEIAFRFWWRWWRSKMGQRT